MVRDNKLRPGLVTGLLILAMAGAYWAGGRLGLLEQVVVDGVHVTPLWPPTGIAVAGLLLLGLRVWPGIALGETLVVLGFGFPPSWGSIGVVAGATAAPVAASLLLRRVGFRVELDRLRDGVALVFLGAFLAMTISASVACLMSLADGTLPVENFWEVWSAWWTGDAMGVLVVAPVLFALRHARMPREIPPLRWLEAILLFGLTVVVTLIATHSSLDLLFLTLPLVMWAALRFQLAGSAPCVLAVSVLVVPAATHHVGPFAHHGLLAVMALLQALNGSVALTGLLLSAVVSERNNTLRTLEQACSALAEVVASLAPAEAGEQWPPPEPGEC